MHTLKTLLALVVLGGLIWLLCPPPALRHPAGARIEAAPLQIDQPAAPLGSIGDYQLTGVARYEITGRVLGTERYWGEHCRLVPYDVALGWGPMSDQAVLDQLEFSQGNRFFFYRWSEEPPIALPEIVSHAANHHIISANREVAAAVARLRRGQCVTFRGHLVNVSGPEGFHWNTSTVRTDSGRGACEVFYVEEVTARDELPPTRSLATK